MLEVVDCLASALGALAVVLLVTPAILVVALPLALGYLRIQGLYIATNRELKRLDSIALSPIFSKFSETLAGLVTLRAFQKQEQFGQQNKGLIDESNRAWWPMQVCLYVCVKACVCPFSGSFPHGCSVMFTIAACRHVVLHMLQKLCSGHMWFPCRPDTKVADHHDRTPPHATGAQMGPHTYTHPG